MLLTASAAHLFVVSDHLDNEYFQLLQHKLRDFNRRAAPLMEPPEAIPLNIRVEDEAGATVGGIAAMTYWGWLVIKLMVLDDGLRGNNLGRRLLQRAHAEAQRRGCTRAQTTTYDFQALRFYEKQGYRIVGTLNDYPDGYNYYWLRKDFERHETTHEAPAADPDLIFRPNSL